MSVRVVGVVGSSARAAVHSLARAGILPLSSQPVARKAGLHGCSMWAIDQFADRDLARVANCTVCPSDGYPNAIPELAKQFPPGPVLYTGGLENHPHVVAQLTESRELWGNPPEVLARVRDPFALFPILNDAGFTTPRLTPRGEPCPTEGRWLRKPFASGGGIGIRFAESAETASPHHYFQEWANGTPMSAVYDGTTLLGLTEQLIGEPWLHAGAFAYCGTIGPIRAEIPAAPLDLRGFWGLDFIATATGACAIEVNPRYTAAVEVLEHAGTKNLSHQPPLLGREGGQKPHQYLEAPPFLREGLGSSSSRTTVGKAVYYAPHAIAFPLSGPWDADLAGTFDPWRLPGFADIPAPGSAIERGWPVLTFFATGSAPAEVRERLRSQAAELDRLFAEHSP